MYRVPRTVCAPAYPPASRPASPVTARKASRSSQGPVANSTARAISSGLRVLLCFSRRKGALQARAPRLAQAVPASSLRPERWDTLRSHAWNTGLA
jgi:hypothetical protein